MKLFRLSWEAGQHSPIPCPIFPYFQNASKRPSPSYRLLCNLPIQATKVPPDSFLCPRFCFTNKPKEQDKQALWKQQKQNRMTPLINFSSDILNFSVSLGYLKRLSEKLREVFIFLYCYILLKYFCTCIPQKLFYFPCMHMGWAKKGWLLQLMKMTASFARQYFSEASFPSDHTRITMSMPKHLPLTCHIILHKIDPNSK